MAWVKVTDRYPTVKGTYRVKVQMCDIPEVIQEDTDYFDGFDWDPYGYQQFINEWFEDTNT